MIAGVASGLVGVVGWVIRHLAHELVKELAYSRQLGLEITALRVQLARLSPEVP